MSTSPDTPRSVSRWRRVRGLCVVLMGVACLIAPFLLGKSALSLIGLLLAVSGVLELIETFSVSDSAGQRSTYLGGLLSVGAGILLMNEPILVLRAIVLFLVITFALDGIGRIASAIKATWSREAALSRYLRGLVDLGLGAALLIPWNAPRLIVICAVLGIRMMMSGWSMLLNRNPPLGFGQQLEAGEYPDSRLGLPAHPRFAEMNAQRASEAEARRPFDAYWCWTFIITFFAIHVGRMNAQINLAGLISPAVAALGDIGMALAISFGLVLPGRLLWRYFTRPVERSAWKTQLARIDNEEKTRLTDRVQRRWLNSRQRFAWTIANMRHSLKAALRWGLQIGLPLAAIVVALNPIWGFSWHFNSENWATEIWNRWAEARTDTWREAMTRAVRDSYPKDRVPNEQLYRIHPDGIDQGDFSFIVIGDTGEGDGSQWCLADRYLSLGKRDDMKFLLLSSDVIYPTGAMFDYQPKFYLPFKGFTKPIYAIPGNHDWYDALEGFAANFLEADAARASMRARLEVDNRISTTTDKHIDEMIVEAARLRSQYGVKNGFQRGPFFDIQTDRFALIAADTGVARTLDPLEEMWFKAALEKARGKCIMVVLGHPFYAGGRYQGTDDEAFAAIHKLLREYKVDIVMAGDTHYFEHYQDKYKADDGTDRTALHFVNGGGGAYMSIGTPLDWPEKADVPDAAYFPSKQIVYDKLDRETPRWKWPLWYWTKRFKAWPLTAEFLSGAFDYNHTPFLQSFVEVKVERSQNRVRIILHGATGPVRWDQVDVFGNVRPEGASAGDVVEFVVGMK